MGAPANRCETCHETPPWYLMRRGDAVVSWACDRHLSTVARNLQVARYDPTELVVTRVVGRRAATEQDNTG